MKFTIEADSDYEVLEAMRTICLSEPEKGLILDQQIERLEADNARRKPEAKATRWNLYYHDPSKAVEFLEGFSDKATAQKALLIAQRPSLPDWEPQYFYLVGFAL